MREIMLCDSQVRREVLRDMNEQSLNSYVTHKLINEAFQVFVVDKEKFALQGKQKIDSTISVRNYKDNFKYKKNYIRTVFWEELKTHNIHLDCKQEIGEIDFIIQESNFGCMDDWGDLTFTRYDTYFKEKELNTFLKAESYGHIINKILYLIDEKGQSEAIRFVHNGDIIDVQQEIEDAFNALQIV